MNKPGYMLALDQRSTSGVRLRQDPEIRGSALVHDRESRRIEHGV
ncbi:hypothetical protein [Paenibacillus sp. MZ04-78.2]|nr:hypothetical protein [Paenibacillus sp. MZ04-78.2]